MQQVEVNSFSTVFIVLQHNEDLKYNDILIKNCIHI